MSELFQYGLSSRGSKTLNYQGYEYMRHRITASCVSHWRCINRSARNCRAIMHTMGNKIVKHPTEHTCDGTTSSNQMDNSNISKHTLENLNLVNVIFTDDLDTIDPVNKFMGKEEVQSPLEKNVSIPEPESTDRNLFEFEYQTYLESEKTDHSSSSPITQYLIQVHPEKNATREQLVTPPVDNNVYSQLIFSEKDEGSAQIQTPVNIKQETLNEQTINEGLVQEELDIKDEEFISPGENNNQELAEDNNFSPITLSSRRKRRSTEFFNDDELFNIRLKAAKLEYQKKKEELNFLKMRVQNEKQHNELRLKIMLQECHNLQ
ncbi:uncharacterized protein LOC109607154 [Aethina tumida]|uniref:uncharacterized protein LOC109607154 n=1 Tax=Aethina tumida TaxID=116153 RepID=UPI00096B0069|nr:uncharacterized protein LOC109607154 [Aethina tumida]